MVDNHFISSILSSAQSAYCLFSWTNIQIFMLVSWTMQYLCFPYRLTSCFYWTTV